jgi:hypothetical protein
MQAGGEEVIHFAGFTLDLGAAAFAPEIARWSCGPRASRS